MTRLPLRPRLQRPQEATRTPQLVDDDFLVSLLPPRVASDPSEKTNQTKRRQRRRARGRRLAARSGRAPVPIPQDARLLLHHPLRVRRAGRRRAGLPPPRQHRLPGGGRRRRRAPPPRGLRQPQGLREAPQLLRRPRAPDEYAPRPPPLLILLSFHFI